MSKTASKIMDQLYGEERSSKVYDRLETLNPAFNHAVQDIDYDYFWALPGLSIRDKSFITLISLIVLQKEEQTRIHYYGFLNAGGSKEILLALLDYLSTFADVTIARKALKEVLDEQNEVISTEYSILDPADEDLAHLAAVVALSRKEETKKAMKHYVEKYPDALKRIENILMHQIVYCGFPVAMNGFAILKEQMG